MALRRRGAIAGGVVAVVLAVAQGAAAQSGVQRGCDRDCLTDVMSQYIDAMVVQRDPKALPLSPSLKSTENGLPAPLGEGLWRRAKAIRYRQIFADPAAGQVGLYGVAERGGSLEVFYVRLKVAGGKITEAETVGAGPGEASLFAPEAMTTPDPIYDETVPPAKRTPRAQMIAAAQAYYDGIEQGDGSKVPAAAGCYRVENGVQTQKLPQYVVAGHCNAGLSGFTYINPVRARRYPIVDLERGLVWAIVIMDIKGGPYTATVDGKPVERVRPASSILVAELFKVVAGRTRRMEVVMRNIPYGGPSGWPDDPAGR